MPQPDFSDPPLPAEFNHPHADNPTWEKLRRMIEKEEVSLYVYGEANGSLRVSLLEEADGYSHASLPALNLTVRE